jgi:hypothetical protein
VPIAISLKQPWAALLILGYKTIEIRTWKTRLRGRVIIHASGLPDQRLEAWKLALDLAPPEHAELFRQGGGVIGMGDILDCLEYRTPEAFSADQERHRNRPEWFRAPMYGYVFANPVRLAFRRFAGNSRLFNVPDELVVLP